MTTHSLSLINVYKQYTQGGTTIPVLRGVDALFEQGASYAITGISGSGKSTLLHLLAGLDKPSSGEILFDQTDIGTFSTNERSLFLNSKLGLMFQFPYLIKELTAQENVALKGLIGGRSHQECMAQALDLLAHVGLGDQKDVYPGQLSGGQQQRVALARGLMNEPDFLIADEPTGNLDEATGTAVIDLMLRIQEERGMGIIVSSHDEYVTGRMNSIYELKDGILFIK